MTPVDLDRLLIGVAGYEFADHDPAKYADLYGWDTNDPEMWRRFEHYHQAWAALQQAWGVEEFEKRMKYGREVVSRAFG